ncbi:DUF1287 domain-containing protein [Sporotomaculum syntrophicum]|nr:DUF1287 domain-containing protein [Sporotomaculum syntrophicum]
MLKKYYGQLRFAGRLDVVVKHAGLYGLLLALIWLTAGCANGQQLQGQTGSLPVKPSGPSPVEKITPAERNVYDWVVIGAREEVARGVIYDASYRQVKYPGGDVPPESGACTDVVIRAFRFAGIDLQQLIHEDMRENFELYPQLWGLPGPDTNIDHRRVPNQMKFFARHGQALPLLVQGEDLLTWQWGDVVYWRFANGLEHCGIISDRKNLHGVPLAIHNAGVAREEDCLTRWEITGHFRYPPVSE